MKVDDIQTLYRHDFCSFAQFAFHCVNPGVPYLDNWHIHLLTDYLTQVEEGKVKRLIINLPPRMLKSHCASVAFAAWVLGRNPAKKLLYLHASNALGKDLEESFLMLVKHPRYQSVFEHMHIREHGRRLKTRYGGYRQYMPIETKLTGIGADIVVVDDPISTLDAQDDITRKQINTQFDQNVLQRLNNKKEGAVIVVMQRLHDDDLTGHLLQKEEEWVHLNLAAFAVHDETFQLSTGKTYSRKMYEALHPERESFEELMEMRSNIGGEAFSTQYLQCQLKAGYGAIEVPKQYDSFDEWAEKDPEAVFRVTFLRDHGLVIIPEPCATAEEWQEKYGEKAKGTYRPDMNA